LKTFEGYFEDQTRHILDNMVTHLSEKPEMKFIYAEMSFFELWWSQQNLETKAQVKKLIERKQLEIVTGGWVMTDEANAHYFSTVMELFEGHEFLRNQLG
jgi:alpha-mannosidase II